jgi:hypothetical protein
MRVERLADALVAPVCKMLWVLFGAVAFVLLIAGANLASLMLARAATRRMDWSVSDFPRNLHYGVLSGRRGLLRLGNGSAPGKHRRRVLDRADRGHAKGVPGRDRCESEPLQGLRSSWDQLSVQRAKLLRSRRHEIAVGGRVGIRCARGYGGIAIRCAA